MARYDFKTLRKDYGIRQQDMAKAVGVTQGFFSSVENDANPFPDDRLDALFSSYPNVDFKKYELPNKKEVPTISGNGSNNQESDTEVEIGSPHAVEALADTIKVILTDRKNHGGDDNKLRTLLDECYFKIGKLQDEVMRLKEMLIDHGIKPSTGEKVH